MVFDWEGIDKSKLFKTRLERRKRRVGEQEVDDDWKKDLGEVATRIWEWWRQIVAADLEPRKVGTGHTGGHGDHSHGHAGDPGELTGALEAAGQVHAEDVQDQD